jgi:hypothetical protein
MTQYIQRADPPLPHLAKGRVDATQWTGTNIDQLRADFPEASIRMHSDGRPNHLIATVTGGELFLRVGQWLIRTEGGSIHAMFRAAFAAQYELAEEPS